MPLVSLQSFNANICSVGSIQNRNSKALDSEVQTTVT